MNEAVLVNEMIDIYVDFILIALSKKGFDVTESIVRRLMRESGLAALYPKKNTSARNQKHKVWPYLLGGLKVDQLNQARQVDITSIKIRGGFVYLVCLINVFKGFSKSLTCENYVDGIIQRRKNLNALERIKNELFCTPTHLHTEQPSLWDAKGCTF